MPTTSQPAQTPSPRHAPLGIGSAWGVGVWYLAVTLAMTWPLAANLARAVPADLGDPLLNCWILDWNWAHQIAVLKGHVHAFAGFWNAAFFHPEPVVLAYSEHLFAEAAQGLPFFVATGSVVVTYNLLFLSTFVLSGLGVYLLVRDLTGCPVAAFLAGLFYACTPYRFAQLGHLQVLSSQWMPFVLFGLRRWLARVEDRARGPAAEAGRARLAGVGPLAGAALALVAQNLSCGYYLVFFAPFLAAFLAWELVRRRLWGEIRVWLGLAAFAGIVVAGTAPFLLPYLDLRRLGFGPRPLDEVRRHSADVFSYLRGLDRSVWRGVLSDFTKIEGTLFQGFVPMVMAAAGAGTAAWRAWRDAASTAGRARGWRRVVAAVSIALATSGTGLVGYELFAGESIRRLRAVWYPMALVANVMATVACALLLLVGVSPRARAAARRMAGSYAVFFAAASLAAAWLSFGPDVQTRGFNLTEQSIYVWFYDHVPGFDGVRAAARFGMLVALFLSVTAGFGVTALGAVRRVRPVVVGLIAGVFLVEASWWPLPVAAIEWSRRDGQPGVVRQGALERLYAFVDTQPRDSVVVELPLGQTLDDTRALYLATRHHFPLVNGYSSTVPPRYARTVEALASPLAQPDEAWRTLAGSGATLAIVHEWAFEGGTGREVSRWLEQHGASLLAALDADRIYRLPRR